MRKLAKIYCDEDYHYLDDPLCIVGVVLDFSNFGIEPNISCDGD